MQMQTTRQDVDAALATFRSAAHVPGRERFAALSKLAAMSSQVHTSGQSAMSTGGGLGRIVAAAVQRAFGEDAFQVVAAPGGVRVGGYVVRTDTGRYVVAKGARTVARATSAEGIASRLVELIEDTSALL